MGLQWTGRVPHRRPPVAASERWLDRCHQQLAVEAEKAALAPVLTVRPPVKLLVEPALAARATPVPPVIFTKPANVAVPPVRLTMTMELFVALVMPPE